MESMSANVSELGQIQMFPASTSSITSDIFTYSVCFQTIEFRVVHYELLIQPRCNVPRTSKQSIKPHSTRTRAAVWHRHASMTKRADSVMTSLFLYYPHGHSDGADESITNNYCRRIECGDSSFTVFCRKQ